MNFCEMRFDRREVNRMTIGVASYSVIVLSRPLYTSVFALLFFFKIRLKRQVVVKFSTELSNQSTMALIRQHVCRINRGRQDCVWATAGRFVIPFSRSLYNIEWSWPYPDCRHAQSANRKIFLNTSNFNKAQIRMISAVLDLIIIFKGFLH